MTFSAQGETAEQEDSSPRQSKVREMSHQRGKEKSVKTGSDYSKIPDIWSQDVDIFTNKEIILGDYLKSTAYCVKSGGEAK